MIGDYLPVLLVFVMAAGLAVFLLVLTHFVGPRVKDKVKLSPYESGVDPVAPAHTRLNIRYFIVGLVFIIFDIEVVFLYPWAVIFSDFIKRSPFILYEMLFFLAVLLIGYVYVWRKGVFEWE
ncbi:MAG: NADH-quinone oxidoreductase subunit A [Calditrichaeota bacterium]|nr:NADH-quinone oxidoreductase subunit A [Calditrichota bacterium]